MEPRGWYSRGYLPHYDHPGLVQFITFRLADSLPLSVVLQMEEELRLCPPDRLDAERRQRIEQFLDSGHGACWLRRPEIASIVEDRLMQSDGSECRLLAWTIMPNHVHVLAEISETVPLTRLLKGWKGSTAVAINRKLDRSGPVWYREYHDRFIRNGEHLDKSVAYIDRNPVRAGLCREVHEWPFGSARLRAEGGLFRSPPEKSSC